MSHFYGKLQGSRGEVTRCGTKTSGHSSSIAGWNGAIRTEVWHDEEAGVDRYSITLTPWQSSGGKTTILAFGILDANIEQQPA